MSTTSTPQPHQPDLFEYAEAVRGARSQPQPPARHAARDAAIEQVDEHADQVWRRRAREIALELAAAGQPFTTDQVRQRLAAERLTTHDDRALGPVMLSMARAGVIRPVGWSESSEDVCHNRVKRLWQGASA